MINRIVKMTFESGRLQEFLQIFHANADLIRKFPGCRSLELLQCCDFPEIIFTHSVWESAESLDKYRASELFLNTWKQTRLLFSAPAEAWTLEKKWQSADNLC